MRFWFCAAAVLAVGSGALTVGLAACNPDIDVSRLEDAGDVYDPSVIPCNAPSDCNTGAACVSSRCDEATRRCVFEVCPTGNACSAISCTTSNKCGRPASFGFQAGTFKIPEGLACPSCVGAVFPYLFVVSNLGLHAYRVSDPTIAMPPELPITALGFTPHTVLTSGRRVYFIGGPTGANDTPYKLQVAWVDAPADVGVNQIRVRRTVFPFPSPDFRFDGAVVGAEDQLFAFHRVQTYENNANVGRDQELLMRAVPAQDPGQLNFIAPKDYPANGRSVAYTNGRLAVYRNNAGIGTWNFNVQPGTSNSTSVGETPLPNMGTPSGSTFAHTADGAVYWSTALRAPPPAQGQPQMISGVRIGMALGDGGGAFGLGALADIEMYGAGLQENNGQPNPNPYVGPVVPMGNNAALVLAAARENPLQTSVQIVNRAGGNLTLAPGKRFLTTARVDQVAAAGTDGFGYVVDPVTPDSMTVTIFSAGCQ